MAKVTNVTDLTAVYNIFITTNKQTANHLSTIKAGKSSSMETFRSKERMRLIKEGGSYDGVFMSTTDMNVLEFSHSYNFGQGAKVDNMIKLKTYEPGMEVLKKFYFMFMQEELGAIKWRKKALKHLANKEKNARRAQAEFSDPKNVRNAEDSPLYEAAAWQAGAAAEKHKQKLMEHIKENAIGQTAYIAYGTGDNLDEWAGPFQVVLGKMNYDNNGKEETLQYEFATDHIARQFDVKGVLGEDPDFEPINFIRPTLPICAFDYDKTAMEGNWGDYGKGIRLPGFTASLHDNIVKIISYYLYSLGIKNHIIVLPNLDLLLASQVAQAIGVNDWHELFGTKRAYTITGSDVLASEAFESSDRGSGKSFVGFNSAVAEDYKFKYDLKASKTVLRKIRELYFELFSWTKETQSSILDELGVGSLIGGSEHGYTLTLREKIDCLFSVLGRIGLRVNKAENESNDTDPALVKFVTAKTKAENQVNALGLGANLIGTTIQEEFGDNAFTQGITDFATGFTGAVGEGVEWVGEVFGADDDWASKGIGYDAGYDDQLLVKDPYADGADQSLRADALLSLELPFQHIKGGGVANEDGAYYMAPLMNIVNTILTAGGQHYFNSTYHWENDVKIVNMFKEKFGSGTFEGYRKNIAKKSYEPIDSPPEAYADNYFVFGDKDLINLFLYGEYANIVNFNKKSRLEETRAWEGIPIEFNKETGTGDWKSAYFLDPFWNRIANDLKQCTQTQFQLDVGERALKESVEDSLRLEGSYQRGVNKSYFSKVKALVKKSEAEMGHFNEYDINMDYRADFTKRLPEEFAFLSTTDDPEQAKAVKDIFGLGPAFFIGNDTNGNVLSYSFDNDQYLFSQFFGSIRELYYNTSLKWSKGISPWLDGDPSDEVVNASLYGILDHISKKGGYYGQAFGKIFKDFDIGLDKGRIATDLTDIILMETTGSTRYVPKGRKSSVVAMVLLFMSLFKHQYRGVIKTLPMFALSNMGILGRPALVLLKSTNRVHTYSEQDRSTADFFSGLYKLLGFKHTISGGSAHSEFIMYKDIEGILGNETD